MELKEIKQRISDAIEQNAAEICSFGDEVLAMPELGYKEKNTSRHFEERLQALGLKPEHYAGTGLKAAVAGKRPGPCVGIIGELDAVSCFGHPHANNETGAAHACGHNAQQASAYGAIFALVRSGVMQELDGSVALLATPAEEFLDMEYRMQLRSDGKIQYFGGKQQMILEGAFDDVSLAMMLHAHPDTPGAALNLDGDSLGFTAKTIDFYGRAAHGSKPFEGINALNAAMLGLMGIHANREIFRDEDHIRIHPIITNGGSVVNSVPDHVRIETYIRGANADAIADACCIVDRSVNGAATAIGATAEIATVPGYLPLRQDESFGRVMEQNAIALWGDGSIHRGVPTTGSTDIGDLSHLIPCIQPTFGGFTGALHSQQFEIADKKLAYLDSARLLAMTAADLLFHGAALANDICRAFHPVFTKQEYLDFLQAQWQ
ncbi:MAG: amidohydrolase [Acutalibacteraceae bacterium]|jgi:amidohydrolase